jgi:hypothetical protein
MMKAYREDIKSGQAKMIAAIKGKTDALIDWSKRNDGLPICNGDQSKENWA